MARATGPVVTTLRTSTSGTGWGRHRAFCVTPSEVIHSCGRLCGDKSQPCNIACLTALKASSRSGPGEATHVRRRLRADVSLLRVLSLAARRPGEPAGSLTRRDAGAAQRRRLAGLQPVAFTALALSAIHQLPGRMGSQDWHQDRAVSGCRSCPQSSRPTRTPGPGAPPGRCPARAHGAPR